MPERRQRVIDLTWPDPNWRDTQDEPCTCRPGDGSDDCPRFDECFAAFSQAQEAARRVG